MDYFRYADISVLTFESSFRRMSVDGMAMLTDQPKPAEGDH